MRKHSGVSDIMQGLTDGAVNGVAGHDVGYWNEQKISAEAFVHMFEAQFDEVRYKEMKKIFPKSLKYFENLLREEVLKDAEKMP